MIMFNPPHPGLVLAENFDDKFTVEDAALKMGVSVKTLTDILDCKAPITKEIALLLAVIFPGEPRYVSRILKTFLGTAKRVQSLRTQLS